MIPSTHDTRSDRATLIYRHYERLYRLAVLVAGNIATAATLVQSAYRQLPADRDSAAETEAFLIRALLSQRLLRKSRWTVAPPDLTYTTLGRAQVIALFRALAALPPAVRLAIGLTYINGSSPAEIDALIGPALGEQTSAQVLSHFRIVAARAVGLVPVDAGDSTLAGLDRMISGQLAEDEALALRRDLIAQPALRDLRDGMIAVSELLPRAIPTLFAAPPPPALVDDLLALIQIDRPAQLRRISTRRAQALLAFGVLALAAAIILLPSLLARSSTPSAARVPSVPELLDDAIHRFDRAPLQQGVLHEQYRVEREGRAAYLIERWYDYAAPNRLAISVSQENRNGPPIFQVGTNGQSLIQLRYGRNRGFGEQPLDVQVSADEAQRLVPLLRGLPHSSAFARPNAVPTDPGPLFLAQARAANATYLGQTNMLDRSAFLLTYQTDQLPASGSRTAQGQSVRVVLTIDAQTYALLDVAVVGAGEAESTAGHPVRAQQFEVLAEAPDARFSLPSGPDVGKRTGMASVRFPFIDNNLLVSLDAAAEAMPDQLFAPLKLPDEHMRGLAVRENRSSSAGDIMLIYEGEFQNMIVLPSFTPNASQNVGEEQTAGAYRYRLIAESEVAGGITAIVYRPEDSTKPLGLILNDDFATLEERETTLRSIIASLTPINDQSLPVLRANFESPSAAAGGT
jgi:DNA-directed RNA polymerase specialized sigma24 family protein